MMVSCGENERLYIVPFSGRPPGVVPTGYGVVPYRVLPNTVTLPSSYPPPKSYRVVRPVPSALRANAEPKGIKPPGFANNPDTVPYMVLPDTLPDEINALTPPSPPHEIRFVK